MGDFLSVAVYYWRFSFCSFLCGLISVPVAHYGRCSCFSSCLCYLLVSVPVALYGRSSSFCSCSRAIFSVPVPLFVNGLLLSIAVLRVIDDRRRLIFMHGADDKHHREKKCQ